MSYTNGWTWADDATEEQQEENAELCEQTYQHILHIFNLIPDPESEWDQERKTQALDQLYEVTYENHSALGATAAHAKAEEAVKLHQRRHRAQIQSRWDEIEFFVEKLAEYGGRLRRAYEHWNEDEKRIAALEGE